MAQNLGAPEGGDVAAPPPEDVKVTPASAYTKLRSGALPGRLLPHVVVLAPKLLQRDDGASVQGGFFGSVACSSHEAGQVTW